MAVQICKSLYVNNLQITDLARGTLASTVSNSGEYKISICIRNTNTNDSIWYDKAQVRIVPVGDTIQFYTDNAFTAAKSPNRFDSPLFELKSKESKWFDIYFKWTGTRSKPVSQMKFDTGVYAHEMPIVSGWKKLSALI